MKPALGVADLIRAVSRLAPLGDDPRAIARVLGFAPREVAAPTAVPAAGAEASARVVNISGTATGTSRASATVSAGTPAQASTTTVTSEHGPLALRPLGRKDAAQPAWLPAPGQGLTRPGRTERPPPPLETLFEPRRHRALLSAALATLDAKGPLDLERLIEHIATRTLDRDLPRLLRPSLHRGAWLLLDRSSAMAPFFEDSDDLADRIVRVIGREVTRVQTFTDSPLLVWDGEQLDDRPIALPPAGTPLVAITDLGIRGPHRAHWLELLAQLKPRGCRAIAIVPYPLERCPPALLDRRRQLTVVPWDRATKVAAVKARGRGTR